MSVVKDIIVKVIPRAIAVDFIRTHHYSGNVSQTSSLHFGCFLGDKLHGVLQFGSPMDKRKVLPLVQPCLWNEMLELNRMAFDDYLPKNSESRCISVAIRLIKKNAPHIKWLLSFADGVQCGHGTIYQASGFVLTGIRKSDQIYETPRGERVTRATLTNNSGTKRLRILKEIGMKDDGSASLRQFEKGGCIRLPGFQLRYIYIIDKSCRLTVPVIPFSRIKELGATMYKGERAESVAVAQIASSD